MKKTITTLILLLFSSMVFADDSASFASFYVQSWSWGWWGFIIAAGVAVTGGAIIFFTGGTASPIVVSVGTWIGGLGSGLTGVAATNSGLALLGGGSIASGGLGMVGGAALLTAVFTFSTV